MRSWRHGVRSFWLVIPLLLAAQSASAIVTVGPVGSGCRFTKIQDAINYVLGKERNAPDDVDPYIGVAGDNFYNEALVVDGSNVTAYTDPFGLPEAFVQIYGNYDQNCNDTPVNTTAAVGAGGSKTGHSVLEITGSRPVRVVLNHFVLTDASGVNTGGGVSVHPSAAAYLDLTNVDINGNHASHGGGIYVSGHAPGHTLALHGGTTIANNTATNDGGGIATNGETFLYATESFFVVSNNTAGGVGGGISFQGHGSMTLGGSAQFAGNHGSEGGGIYVNADRPTDINFYDGVFIGVNQAVVAGGGMTIAGQAKLYAQSSVVPTQIFSNEVLSDTGAGGGVAVLGPAEMRFSGSIYNNSAGYGGGVAAIAGSDSLMDAYVALTAASPTSPVSVSNNGGTHAGGGIYVKANSTFTTSGDDYIYATVCASNFVIDSNGAAEGTAIYADSGDGGFLTFTWGSTVALNFDGLVRGRQGCPQPIRCAAGIACNEIVGNYRSGGGAGDGATILVQEASELDARNVRIQGNQGAHALRSVRDSFGIDAGTLLVTDNQVDGELIDSDNADLKIVDSTIANNTIGNQYVIRASGHIDLVNSIVAEATPYTVDFAGNNNLADRNFDFVLTNRSDPTVGSSGYVLYDTPSFVDVANRDYHLRPYSPGLDVAPAVGNSPPDLDGAPRDVDLPQIVNNQGPRDIGAYERLSIPPCSAPDAVFCNGFNGI
jgi:predicted outer membrane repeat protein